jgi:hypothetical protein
VVVSRESRSIAQENESYKLVHFGGYEKTYQAWYGVAQDSLATNRTFNVAGTDFGARPTCLFQSDRQLPTALPYKPF